MDLRDVLGNDAARERCKKRCRAALATVGQVEQLVIFVAWAACQPTNFMKYHSYAHLETSFNVWARAHRSRAAASNAYSTIAVTVRKAVKDDKAIFFDDIAAAADHAAAPGDNSALYRLANKASDVKTQALKVV